MIRQRRRGGTVLPVLIICAVLVLLSIINAQHLLNRVDHGPRKELGKQTDGDSGDSSSDDGSNVDGDDTNDGNSDKGQLGQGDFNEQSSEGDQVIPEANRDDSDEDDDQRLDDIREQHRQEDKVPVRHAQQQASPHVLDPWVSYPPLPTCPTWFFGAPDGGDDPWMLPEPRAAVFTPDPGRCQTAFGPVVHITYAGSRTTHEADGIEDWREREAIRLAADAHHAALVEELVLQLRCRIAGLTVSEVTSSTPDEDNGGGAGATTDQPPVQGTSIVLHALSSNETSEVGLHAAHRVAVASGTISLWAGTREGVAYAVASLINVFVMRNHTGTKERAIRWMQMPMIDASRGKISIACGAYASFDGAMLSYRGLMLDVARHFLPVEEVARIMHVMAMLKLNVLHLHLSDDQGWRLAMDDFPELQSFGARRGPNVNPSHSKYAGIGIRSNVDTPECYTLSDVRRLRHVARLLHIAIIPEVDVPAHSAALIRAAIAARSVSGESPSRTSLASLDGFVEVHEGCHEARCTATDSTCHQHLAVNCMGGTHGLLIPTEGTMSVLRHLLHVVLTDYFPESRYIHIGGDETNQFNEATVMTPELKASCRQQWETAGDSARLADWHANMLIALSDHVSLEPLNRRAIVWDDSLKHLLSKKHHDDGDDDGSTTDDDSLPFVQWWRDWHADGRWNVMREAKALKILSPTSNAYLDATQRTQRSEDRFRVQDGTVTEADVWKLRQFLDNLANDRVLGIEACLWSEMLVNQTVLWYQLLPRLVAHAHVAWGGTEYSTTDVVEVVPRRASRITKLVEATLDIPPMLIS